MIPGWPTFSYRPLLERAVIEVHRQLLLLHRQHAGEQVHVDALTLARAVAVLERGENPDARDAAP